MDVLSRAFSGTCDDNNDDNMMKIPIIPKIIKVSVVNKILQTEAEFKKSSTR